MDLPDSQDIPEPELERQGRRLAASASTFLLVALALLVPGLLMVVLGGSWVFALGITLAALSGPPAVVGIALLGSSAVSRWAARHRPFA